ncbi:hypothetical protein [Vibrio vulnificus]|uniref:hypothetical protein n=1 Tax=Vibrio vulnificus TaxID=672 RepID=UPI003ED96BF2
MNNNLKDIFDKSRQELLDMGLRGNTLLSLSKGARVLDIVDEKSIQVFDTLVNAQKPMAFASVAASDVVQDTFSIEHDELVSAYTLV